MNALAVELNQADVRLDEAVDLGALLAEAYTATRVLRVSGLLGWSTALPALCDVLEQCRHRQMEPIAMIPYSIGSADHVLVVFGPLRLTPLDAVQMARASLERCACDLVELFALTATIAWAQLRAQIDDVVLEAGAAALGRAVDLVLDAAADPPAASDGASGGPGPSSSVAQPSGPGSPALADTGQGRAELIAQLLEVIVPQPGMWHSFILGYLRRHHAERLEQLPVEVLHTVLEQSYTLNAARGGK